MSILSYSRAQLEAILTQGTWEKAAYSEFGATFDDKERLFPCIFGVAGFKADQLRFSFLDRIDAKDISLILQDYLLHARSYGQNTSLVLFFRPESIQTMSQYRDRFWTLLRELSEMDNEPWPEDVSHKLDNPSWEFCFAGEPVFVVCSTPAHEKRNSRHAPTFMLTFQPRWVFETILKTRENAEEAFSKVRDRLEQYDGISPSPALGHYGDPDNREYQQYFIGEDNGFPACPFESLTAPANQTRRNMMVEIYHDKTCLKDIPRLIAAILPDQGCIEVQRDVKDKEHFWHEHATDETIVILKGELRFYWDEGETICKPGDVISLPAGTRHGSIALENGATYLIACHTLGLSDAPANLVDEGQAA